MTDFRTYAKTNLIYKTLCGSHIYGTNVAESDKDYQGVFVEPKEVVFGLFKVDEVDFSTNKTNTANSSDDIDYKVYAFRRFVELAATKSNPNILELLFVRKNHIQFMNEWGERLRAARGLFVSKMAYDKFCGYAHAQRMRMEQSDRNPHGGRGWMVEKYGYDVKYAMHVVRLYMEGVELLSDGELELPLKENKLLLNIRLGKYTKEDCMKLMDEWKVRAEAARLSSTLPKRPDVHKVNEFLIDFYERYFYSKRDFDRATYKAKLQAVVDEL